ncbi:zinc finger with UFM1-specific peptidase domain protein-like [Chenopodium quinoa]|uniref:UFSP1/2/DUB catalytic domain-containing protein n=1 Tax=Chenopodium quinoa TaxID=63459 RepID=A0A803L254_CHEQI|nr:zinc finger with UFM1-specific peptidase domain protein-like [Chenopodium quinoa]
MNYSCCPICENPIPINEIEWHVNNHLEDDEFAKDMELAQQIALAPPSPPQIDRSFCLDFDPESVFEEVPESSTSRDLKSGSRKNEPKDIDEQICCIISLQSKAIFYKVESGLMTLLKNCLELENSTSILSGYVDHFQSTRSEDMGWGCGWRNIQMVSSHLLMERPEARKVLFGGSEYVPEIGSLQRWLEVAWQRGFDIVGSKFFKGEIYGSKKWIGTTECAALLCFFGLRAKIVDFDGKGNKRDVGRVDKPMDRFVARRDIDAKEGPAKFGDGSTQNSKGYQALIDWVWSYFSEQKPKESQRRGVVVTNKMPLYFQHQGHSRTIIGIQAKHQKNGQQQYNLLVLDPAHNTEALERSLKENCGWQKFLKRGLHTLRKPQYQLCYVDPGIARGEEIEKLKDLTSVLIEC